MLIPNIPHCPQTSEVQKLRLSVQKSGEGHILPTHQIEPSECICQILRSAKHYIYNISNSDHIAYV